MSTPPPDPTMTRLRADAADLGMFFGLAEPLADQGWQPAATLYTRGTVPPDDPLANLLADVNTSVGGEPRVAASLLYQGFASRLWSPQLAWLLLGGRAAPVPPDGLLWRRPTGQLLELAAPVTPGRTGEPASLLGDLIESTFTAHLDPLAAAVTDRVKVAAELLRGNAAAALLSGLRLVATRLGSDWWDLSGAALAHPRLRGTGRLTGGPPWFVRTSCCLYYRTGGGLCGDCPLESVP